MKKIIFSLAIFWSITSSEGPKTIVPGSKNGCSVTLKQFSQFGLDTQLIESQTPSSEQWTEKTTSLFNIWLDFGLKRAVINHKKIRKIRDIEMVRRNWPHQDKFTIIVRSEREKILSNTKTEIKLKETQNIDETINLDAFGYIFSFNLSHILPKDCVSQGLIINPSSRDFLAELKKSNCLSTPYLTSLTPAFNRLLAADYRLTLCKTE